MKVLVSVFNNLYTDQRVEKVCRTLHVNNFQVELIGNNWDGLPEMQRPYSFSRISLKSKNLKLGYPEFNIKLYRELLKRADKKTILLSNDLDTLLANYLVSKKLNIPLVFDSHEIFTEMPSVNGRFTQKIWRRLERYVLPKLKYMITASESYANWFSKTYKIPTPVVVQNFPTKAPDDFYEISDNSPKIILYQGTINFSRGIDKAIEAMQFIENAEFWIAGNGPMLNEYQLQTKRLGIEKKVKFLGKLTPSDLQKITQKADVGLSIEENNGLSYYYSLPNKISDYIKANVPIVVSDFPEMKKIIENHNVGEIITNHNPKILAEKINIVLNNGKSFYQSKLKIAAYELCWEKEEPKILQLFEKVVSENFQN